MATRWMKRARLSVATGGEGVHPRPPPEQCRAAKHCGTISPGLSIRVKLPFKKTKQENAGDDPKRLFLFHRICTTRPPAQYDHRSCCCDMGCVCVICVSIHKDLCLVLM